MEHADSEFARIFADAGGQRRRDKCLSTAI